MLLNKLITVAGIAGTLGAATPAFADWDDAPPPPAYNVPAPVYGYGYDGDDWRERAWRRHEAWERYRHWRRWEWRRHHRWGW
jgi:hypothetical protein